MEEEKETIFIPHNDLMGKYYLEALKLANDIKIKKAKDYEGGENIKNEDYFLYGEKSIMSEIWKKTLRLRNLIDTRTEDNPQNETFDDTLLDLINYVADFYAYRKMKRGKNDD